jgi:hypothetical protein
MWLVREAAAETYWWLLAATSFLKRARAQTSETRKDGGCKSKIQSRLPLHGARPETETASSAAARKTKAPRKRVLVALVLPSGCTSAFRVHLRLPK